MNNTKVAVVFSEKRSNTFYINNNLGLIEALSSLPKNYHVEFFFNTPVMGAFEKDNKTFWFKNTVKAMAWAVNKYFEPNIFIGVGNANYAWDKIVPEGVKKIFIYDSYEEPKSDFVWDKVIVPVEDDLLFFPHAKVMSVYNSNLFKPTNSTKHFTYFYPQLTTNIDLLASLTELEETMSFTELDTLFYLSDFSSSLMKDLLNQSRVACIIESDNDVELALSALACGVPVVTTEDTKASTIEGVHVSLATLPDFQISLDIAESEGYKKIDLSKYTIESYNKELLKLL